MVNDLKPPAGLDVFVVCAKDKETIEEKDFIALGNVLYETFLRSTQDAKQINRVLDELQKKGEALVTTNKSTDIIESIMLRALSEMSWSDLKDNFRFEEKKAVIGLPKLP